MEARGWETAVRLSDGTAVERPLVPGETCSAYSPCFASPPWSRMGLGEWRVGARPNEMQRGDWRGYASVCSTTEGHRGGYTLIPELMATLEPGGAETVRVDAPVAPAPSLLHIGLHDKCLTARCRVRNMKHTMKRAIKSFCAGAGQRGEAAAYIFPG